MEEKKTYNTIIVVLIIVLVLLFAFIFYMLFRDTGNNADNSDNSTDIDTSILQKDFIGEFVSAKLPHTWYIEEYKDGEKGFPIYRADGTIDDTKTYAGLTGLVIKNEESEEIFNMLAISRDFEDDYCKIITKFSDTETEYITSIRTQAESQFSSEEKALGLPIINNYIEDSFVDLTYLGTNLRRHDADLYLNADTTGNYFNPICNSYSKIIYVPELTFMVNDSTTLESREEYTYYIMIPKKSRVETTPAFGEDDLSILDQILQTITVND